MDESETTNLIRTESTHTHTHAHTHTHTLAFQMAAQQENHPTVFTTLHVNHTIRTFVPDQCRFYLGSRSRILELFTNAHGKRNTVLTKSRVAALTRQTDAETSHLHNVLVKTSMSLTSTSTMNLTFSDAASRWKCESETSLQ